MITRQEIEPEMASGQESLKIKSTDDNLIRLSLERWMELKEQRFTPRPKRYKYGYLNPDPKKVEKARKKAEAIERKKTEGLASL